MKVLKNKFYNKTFRGAGKPGGNAGDVYLTPPETSDLYQSSSILKSLDVLCEGPIEGLCLNDGKKAEGIDVFGAIYFDETPIKENTEKIYQTGAFSASDIQLVDRASLSSLNQALSNIQSNLSGLITGDDTSSGLAAIADNNISNITSELSDLFSNFDQYQSLINQLGIIQYNTSGVITNANSTVYSNTKSPIYPSFLFNDSTHERFLRVENGEEIIKLPENIFAFAPTFNTGDAISEENSVFDFYRITNFIGGGIMFFFIGDEIATGAGGGFLTGKFLTETSNINAIQSGIDNGYDVLGTGVNFVEYLTVPYNQVNPSRGETIGKQINFGANIDNNLRFNFNKAKIQYNKGDEFQKPLNGFGEITRDYQINARLLGPFSLTAGGDGAATGATSSGFVDQFGNTGAILKAGLGNKDVREDGSFNENFAAWNQNVSEEHDGYDFKHIIYQNEVDSVAPTLAISLLRDTESSDDDTLGRTEPAGITFNFDVGFEGDYDETDVETLLEQGVHPKFIALNQFKSSYKAAYYGIVENNYLNSPYEEITLPKNSALKDFKISDIDGISGLTSTYNLDPFEVLYPNESWKEIKRYIKTQKTSYETESALIQREASLYAITEKINSQFKYPFSSLVGTTIEARSFSSPPVRTYDAKLKKILIPSNYAPLRADGSDKRFIRSSSDYGLREVFQFNGSSYLKVPEKIDFGTENYEISFKVKFGSFNTSTTPVYFLDVDGGNFNTPGRVAVYHRDDGDGSSPEIGMVGKDDAGNTDFIHKDISISAYSASDIFSVSLKAVGNQYTLTVKVGETLVGTQTGTLTNRPSFSYDPSAGTNLLIGSNTTHASSSFLDNGTQIADLKIKKNNQLLHFFDGTVITTERFGSVFKDKFGGAHADIIGSVSTVEDSTFQFGRNKEQIYIGEWDGTFKYSWSDNPAWVLYDLMVNPVYGIRNQIDDLEDIDIFELYEIGRYCDGVDSDGCFDGVSDDRGGIEPRFSCNILLNTKENAFNLIGNIASIFRCAAYWAGGSFNFSIDKPKEPTAIFNNSNVLDGAFNYGDILKQSRFTRVEVLYADKNDFYKIKKEYVEDEDGIRKYGTITNTQNGIGATSRSQARRLGKYILTSNKFETETIEFSTDQTALFLNPGSVIRVDDELKNFEINYGKILGSSFDGSSFFVEIENTINTGSIKTGDDSAIYLYKNNGQTEIETLYDIVKFDQTYQFGDNSDNYSGVLTSDKIAGAYIDFVFKTEITGISLTNNNKSIKLDLNVNDDVSLYGSGIKRGSPFNLKLTNEVNEFYKITSIKEESENVYKINGLQYDSGKFNVVELEDYQEVDEEYNIGIPTNNINRPTPPSGFTTGIENNNGFLSLVGDITGVLGGTETKYRVSLFYPNGSYSYKEFLKDDSFSPPVTHFELHNISQAGTYNIVVTSMRNPESADSPKKSFVVNSTDFSESILFRNIKLNKEINIIQNEVNYINYKTGESVTENDNFYVSFKDNNGSPVSFNSYYAPHLKIKLFDEENHFVRDMVGKYRSNNFAISRAQKEEFIENQRLYTLGFYLYNKDNELEDTFMYSVKNEAPNINITDSESYQDKIVFTLDMVGSLDTKKIDVYSSLDGENFSKLKTQNISPETKKTVVPVFYSEIKSYKNIYYKFLPSDIIGTGNWSDISSGTIIRSEQTPSTSIPYSQISQQLNQSLVSVYFAQFDENLSGTYFSNGSNGFNFKEFDGDGRELGYNLILDCSYSYSGSEEQRTLSLNGSKNLDLSSPEASGEKTSYKKKKYPWAEYGEIEFSLSLDNFSGITIDQINLEIEKFYK